MHEVVEYLLIAVLSAIVLSVVLYYIYFIPRKAFELSTVKWEALKEVYLAVNSNPSQGYTLPREAVVYVYPAILRINNISITVTSVRLVWKCASPSVDLRGGVWCLRGNGTHAFLYSTLYIVDRGSVLEVYYYNASVEKTKFLGFGEHSQPVFTVFISNATIYFNGTLVYGFEGTRKIVVKCFELKP